MLIEIDSYNKKIGNIKGISLPSHVAFLHGERTDVFLQSRIQREQLEMNAQSTICNHQRMTSLRDESVSI